jgi:hypothetical protein
MMRKLAPLFLIVVAACVPRPIPITQGDPVATAALLALPDAQFFAQTRLAGQVATACPSLVFNQRFHAALVAQRFGTDRHNLVQTANRRAVDLETDVATRSLQARYDVTFDQGALCSVGEGEIVRKSALSAVLLDI